MVKFLDGKKTMLGLVLIALAAAMRGVEQLTGVPLQALAEYVNGIGLALMGVGAADKLRKGA